MFDYDTETGEIWLFDTIGPEWAGMVSDGAIVEALAAMGSRDVTLRINSPGGDVPAATAIYNEVQRYKGHVVASIEGLAASAASYLMLAADEVIAAKNSIVMIHSPWTATLGNAAEHRQTADVLDKFEASLIGMYSDKTGKTVDEIAEALQAETWMTAEEALAFGLVDSIGNHEAEPAKVAAGMYAKTPAALVKQVEAGSLTPYPVRRQAAKVASRKY